MHECGGKSPVAALNPCLDERGTAALPCRMGRPAGVLSRGLGPKFGGVGGTIGGAGAGWALGMLSVIGGIIGGTGCILPPIFRGISR